VDKKQEAWPEYLKSPYFCKWKYAMNLDPTIQKLLQQQNYSQALEQLESSLKDSPDRLNHYAAMGYCLYKLGDFGKSVEKYSLALALDPAQAQLYSDRGLSYFMMGQQQPALQDFNTAQEMEPQNPYRYSSRAYVRDAFGDIKGAIGDYQKAVELDPEDSVAYNNMGLLLEKLGYQKEAKQLFDTADQLEGRSPAPVSSTQKAPASPAPKKKMTATHLGSVLRSVFTTRQGFQEFLQYWLGKRSDR
jgi:tetratricopeptide (TPR) repeat protein